MVVIYNYGKPGFPGILVDTDNRRIVCELAKLSEGWKLGAEYKRRNGVGGMVIRLPETFQGFPGQPEGVTEGVAEAQQQTEAMSQTRPTVASKYNIATRFDFMERLIDMVIGNVVPSCIITGPGGVGKTHTVMTALATQGMNEGDYVLVKGFTTPLGLYRTLHDHRRAMVIFDDCDSAFKDPTAVNLLKGALDSTDRRVISWNSSRLPEEMDNSFEFRGRIVFISNTPIGQFSQALISRSMIIDLQMSRDEVLDRIGEIGQTVGKGCEQLAIDDVLAFLKENKDCIGDLNIRTFIKVLKIRLHNRQGDWKGMAEFMTCS